MRFRTIAIGIVAIVAALAGGALCIALSGWALHWLDGLSAREKSTLRTLIIMTGALMPVLGVVLRRSKAEVDDDQNV